MADAEDRAADLGARVINLSLGSEGPSLAERTVIRAHPDVLFVAAAGNQARDDDAQPTYPCAYDEPNVLCVGAEARAGGLASFSNWGARSVDLLAPGEHIASTWTGGTYRYADGTSMAAPFASAAAAALLGRDPALTPAQLRAILVGSSRPDPTVAGRVVGGDLDLGRALAATVPADAAPRPRAPGPRPPRRPRARPPRPRLRAGPPRRSATSASAGGWRAPAAPSAAATASASPRAAPAAARPRARGATRAPSKCAGAWRAGPRSASRSSVAPAAPAGAAGASCAASAPTRGRAGPPAEWAPRPGGARSPAGATACASPRSAPRAGRAPSASWADATTLGTWATSTRTRTTTPGTTTPGTTTPGTTTTPSSAADDRRWLLGALGLVLAFMVVEVVAGLLASSLALLSDAAHMLTDAARSASPSSRRGLAARPARGRFTFGLGRAEILSAQANGVALLVLAGVLGVEAVGRLAHPADVDGGFVLVVGLVGAAVNVGTAWAISRAQRRSLNVEGAMAHVVADLVSSLLAALAGAADPRVGARPGRPRRVAARRRRSWSGPAARLLRAATDVLLEAAPRGIDVDAIGLGARRASRASSRSTTSTSGRSRRASRRWPPTCSCAPGDDCHAVRRRLQRVLGDRFGVDHVTLQVDHAPGRGAPARDRAPPAARAGDPPSGSGGGQRRGGRPRPRPRASAQHDVREGHRAAGDLGRPHRVHRLAPAVGGAAGVEDREAVRRDLQERDVRVAEHDGGAAGEAATQALEPAGGRPGVVHHPDPRAVRLHDPLRGQRRAGAPGCPRCRARRGPGGPSASSSARTPASIRSPPCRTRSAARRRSTHASGSRRPPRGRWVSEMIARRTAAPDATAPRRARARAARALARRATTVRSAARERRTWRRRTVRAGRACPSAPTSPESQRWRRSRRATPYQL